MRTLLTLAFMASLIAGCVAVEGTTPKEDAKAGIELWKCYDSIGWGIIPLVTLTANLHNGTGEIKFGEIVKTTPTIADMSD